MTNCYSSSYKIHSSSLPYKLPKIKKEITLFADSVTWFHFFPCSLWARIQPSAGHWLGAVGRRAARGKWVRRGRSQSQKETRRTKLTVVLFELGLLKFLLMPTLNITWRLLGVRDQVDICFPLVKDWGSVRLQNAEFGNYTPTRVTS